MMSYSDLVETGLLLVQALNFIAYIYFNIKKR
jgi:hypothetical protein